MVSALTFMHWRAFRDRNSLFFLARFFALFTAYEPSLLKGLLCYGAAIIQLDFTHLFHSLEYLLASNIVEMTEKFQKAVRAVADASSLVHTLQVVLPDKYRNKRKYWGQPEIETVNLAAYLSQCVGSEVRKAKNNLKS